MLDRLKRNKLYIKYGVFIIFVGIVTVLTVKAIAYWDYILDWCVIEVSRFFSIISPVIYAVLLSYLLYQPIKYIETLIYKGILATKKGKVFTKYNKIIRIFSIFIILSVVVLLFVIIYNFLIPPLFKSINDIINSLPEFQAQLKSWINEIVEQLNSKNIAVESTGELSGEIIDKVGGTAEKVLDSVISLFSNISTMILDFVITIILTLYFLVDKERLVNQLRKVRDGLLSEKASKRVSLFVYDFNNIVGGFLVGEVLDAVLVGIVSTILLLLIKHPFAVLIGVIAGITNVIPYVGPIIGAALAFFFGIFTSVPMGITGAILLLMYQQVDGNFIQPKIVGDKIGLSPVWILIVVLIGGSYFGALGMILSMPIAGLIRIYLNRYGNRKINNN